MYPNVLLFLGYFFNEPTKSSLIGEKSPNLVTLIMIDDSRATLQIVASLTDKSRGIINDCKVFIVQATAATFTNFLKNF